MISMVSANGWEYVNGLARQVMFWDGTDYCSGIMIGKTIICGCCGAIFELEDVIEGAKEEGVIPVKVFETWVDICDEIRGSSNCEEDAINLVFEEEN